jgi:hypothetical protein
MNAILRGITRLLFVVSVGVLTVAPSFGIVDLSIQYFTTYPYIVIIADILWAMLIIAILPLSMTQYKYVSTSLFVILSLILLFLLMTFVPTVFNFIPVLVWVFVVLFASIGWLLIAPPLWRWVHGILPVYNSNSDHQ